MPHTITASEATVLRVLSKHSGESNPYELAAGAKLTTREVNEAVSHLADKHLVEIMEDGRYIGFTSEGQRVALSLAPPRRSDAFVLVVPDSQDRPAHPIESLDSEALDAALEAEIGKGSGR